MSNVFGDYEPEDAWCIEDDNPALLHNLFARLALVDHKPEPSLPDDVSKLDAIVERVRELRALRGTFDTRAALRVDQLVDDVRYMRGRV